MAGQWTSPSGILARDLDCCRLELKKVGTSVQLGSKACYSRMTKYARLRKHNMPGFTARFSKISLDIEKFRANTDRAIKQEIRQAAKEFLNAALPKVPIRTGFVRGAFGVLEDFVGQGANNKGQRLAQDLQRLLKSKAFAEKRLAALKGRNPAQELSSLESFAESRREILRELAAKAREAREDAIRFSKQPEDKRRALERKKELYKRYGVFRTELHRARQGIKSLKSLIERKVIEKETKKYTQILRLRNQQIKSRKERLKTDTKSILYLAGKRFAQSADAEQFERLQQKQHTFAKKKGVVNSQRDLNKIGRFEYYSVPGSKRRVLKTPRSGREFANIDFDSALKENVTKVQEGFLTRTFKNKLPTYKFSFRINISYFNINDVRSNLRTPSAPWGAYAAGQAAFLQYVRTRLIGRLKEKVKMSSFLVTTASFPNAAGKIGTTSQLVVSR